MCCDCCPEKENLAEKTCVKCEVSFCNEHIKDHLTRAAFADHPLVKPLPEVLKRKCPVHRDEVARHYCGKSGSYVCKLCTTESNQLNVAKMVSGVIQTPLEVSFSPGLIVESSSEYSSLDLKAGWWRKQTIPETDKTGFSCPRLQAWTAT